MKKLLSATLLAIACLCNAYAIGGLPFIVEVSNATELSEALEKYSENSDVHIKLTGDCIFGASLDVKKHFDKFCGILDGAHTRLDENNQIIQEDGKDAIFNYTIKGLREPLFDKMEGANVHNIRFEDCSDPDSHSWFSFTPFVLSETATNSEISDVILEGCHYHNEWSSGPLGNLVDNLGLLVGYMNNCQVQYVTLYGCTLFCVATDVGGIAGEAEDCTFRECSIDPRSSVYSGVEPNAYVGGLVGRSTGCYFYNCTNGATVGASQKADNVGGLTGTSTSSHFFDCSNTGILSQASSESFIAYENVIFRYTSDMTIAVSCRVAHKLIVNLSWFEHEPSLSNWVNRMKVQCREAVSVALILFAIRVAMEFYSAQDPDEMGGMSGAAYGCTYERCENLGMIFCRDAYSGGIVGRAGKENGISTVIRNCINNGYVQGNEQVGGIVGDLDYSHVYNCINTGMVDAVKDTQGSIYGKRDNATDSPVQNCFAMKHDAENMASVAGGQEIYNFNLLDVKSGRVAYEMNRLLGEDVFRQNVGEDFYPTINSNFKTVTAGDIRNDVSLPYHVKNLGEFTMALFNQYADIVLDDNIDFDNSYFSLYRKKAPFHGSIDGQGHSIMNLKIDTGDSDDNIDKWDLLGGERARFGFICAAEGAVFKNFALRDFSITLPDNVGGLVCESTNCTYENVSLAGNSYIGALNGIGGMVFKSDSDHFIGCIVGDSVTVDATDNSFFDYDSDAGALVSEATGSTFTDCVNNGDVFARTDGAGGIVADGDNCTFTRCINNGLVAHSSKLVPNDDEVGGIAATAENCNFYECINNGRIRCHDEYGGGIVGRGVSCTLNNCLNTTATLGSAGLEFSKDGTSGGIIGEAKYCLITNCCSAADWPLLGNSSIFGNDDRSDYNFSVADNGRSTSAYEKAVTSKEMKSGLVAHYLNTNNSNGANFWRQNLTAHDGMQVDVCPVIDPTHDLVTLESRTQGTAISSSKDLMDFAKRVNEGDKDQFASAYLTADIDMDGYDWTPIGNNSSFGQWRGAFDGRGHTINNLKVNTSGAAGLFGVAHVGAEIRNVIIGEGSEITSTGDEGAAGILGQVQISWDWGFVHIENCGSYASVNGKNHAAGIFGRYVPVNGNDDVRVYISNCFNMGTITASEGNSGLLCGYTRNSAVISGCWSGGKLLSSSSTKPYDPTHNEYFAGYSEKIDIQRCYSIDAEHNVQGLPSFNASQPGVLDLYQDNLSDGQLTYRLNGSNDAAITYGWQQELGVDEQPVWGSKGVFLTRTVSEESKGYGMSCLPYTVKSDDDIRYYTFTEATEANGIVKLNFNYAKTVPAGTPALFRVNTPGTYTIYGADGGVDSWSYLAYSSPTEEWKLVGTFDEKTFSGADAQGVYCMEDGVFCSGQTIEVAPYNAYISSPETGSFVKIFTEDNAVSVVFSNIAPEKIPSKLETLKAVLLDPNAEVDTNGLDLNWDGTMSVIDLVTLINMMNRNK